MNSDQQSNNTLRLEYVAIDQAIEMLAPNNPVKHDIGGLYKAIKRYGFRVPVCFDSTLNAINDGNGRTETVFLMYKDWVSGQLKTVPQFIKVEGNMWYLPVIYGIASKDIAEAEAFLLDVNMSSMSGGDYTALDLLRKFEVEQFLPMAQFLELEHLGTDDITALQAYVETTPTIEDVASQPTTNESDSNKVFLRIPFKDVETREMVKAALLEYDSDLGEAIQLLLS